MKNVHQPKMTEQLQLDDEKVITLKANRSHPFNCGLQIVHKRQIAGHHLGSSNNDLWLQIGPPWV